MPISLYRKVLKDLEKSVFPVILPSLSHGIQGWIMKKLELEYGFQLNVTHVAGTRMIDQGTNRISRGALDKGVACGQRMLDHCPWGKSAATESKLLVTMLSQWCGKDLKVLSPLDWSEAGHDIVGWRKVKKGLNILLLNQDLTCGALFLPRRMRE